jgi:hypothetical protein
MGSGNACICSYEDEDVVEFPPKCKLSKKEQTDIHSAQRQRQCKKKELLNRQDDVIDGAPVSLSGRELVAVANAFLIKFNVTEYLNNLRDADQTKAFNDVFNPFWRKV